MGHTEDALSETVNNYYIIAAHVIPGEDESGGLFSAREEKFEALAYAGHLPGYASGHNYHGLVFSINTIFVSKPLRGRIRKPRVAPASPRSFFFIDTRFRCIFSPRIHYQSSSGLRRQHGRDHRDIDQPGRGHRRRVQRELGFPKRAEGIARVSRDRSQPESRRTEIGRFPGGRQDRKQRVAHQ